MPKVVQSGSPAGTLQRFTATDGRQGLQVDETVAPVVDIARLETTPFGGQQSATTAIGYEAGSPLAGDIRYFVVTPRDDLSAQPGLVAFELFSWNVASSTTAFFLAKIVTTAERAAYSAGAVSSKDFPNLNSPEQGGAIALLRPIMQECKIAGAAFPATGIVVDTMRVELNRSSIHYFPPGLTLRDGQSLVIWTPTLNPTYGVSVAGRVWTQARPRTQ